MLKFSFFFILLFSLAVSGAAFAATAKKKVATTKTKAPLVSVNPEDAEKTESELTKFLNNARIPGDGEFREDLKVSVSGKNEGELDNIPLAPDLEGSASAH